MFDTSVKSEELDARLHVSKALQVFWKGVHAGSDCMPTNLRRCIVVGFEYFFYIYMMFCTYTLLYLRLLDF